VKCGVMSNAIFPDARLYSLISGASGLLLFTRLITIVFIAIAISRLIPLPPGRNIAGRSWLLTAPPWVASILGSVTAIVLCSYLLSTPAAQVAPVSPSYINYPATVAAAPLAEATQYVGILESNEVAAYRPVQQFATIIADKPNIVAFNSPWNEPFGRPFAETLYSHGAIPLANIDPGNANMAAIATGKDDRYLRSYADQVVAYGHPVILSFAPEPNSRSYKWRAPDAWVAAWRHVVEVFREDGASNATWLWAMAGNQAGTGPIQAYWPGASYVTWVGIGGYYSNSSQTFQSIFGPTIRAVRQFTEDPILLSDVGIAQAAGQAAKLSGLFAGIRRYDLLGLVWSDTTLHRVLYRRGWRLGGYPAAVTAFRRGLGLILAPRGQNLVPNSSLEVRSQTASIPLGWQHGAWGTNKTTFNYSPNGGRMGSGAVEVRMTQHTSGDGKWFFNPVRVRPDAQYRFMDWYQATTATQVGAVFSMSDGSMQYQIIGMPGPTAGAWENFSTTVSVPLGAQAMTIYHLIQSVGTLRIDGQNLETYSPTGFAHPLVTLTFDDGYVSQYTQTMPLLRKYGFPSTQFIITGDINMPRYLTVAQVKGLYRAGNEIASHTVTHDEMIQESPDRWTMELRQSRMQLQKWIGAPTPDLAYPNGLYSEGIVAAAQKYYSAARGVEDGLNGRDNFNVYDIKVQNIFDTTTTAQVSDWLRQAARTRTWLVLVYHSVISPQSGAGIYNVTRRQLDSELAAIKASGLSVVTMQQALKQLIPQM